MWRRMGDTATKGGGARRWLTRWRTLLTTTTLLSQRAEPSLLWSGHCLESLMGHGLARLPRVSFDTRGRAVPDLSPRRTVLRAERHLNVGFWLRSLIDEALEEHKTRDGLKAEKRKLGACSQPDISDREHGQLATPLDGPGEPWPLPSMSDARNLPVASWPTVSCRVDS